MFEYSYFEYLRLMCKCSIHYYMNKHNWPLEYKDLSFDIDCIEYLNTKYIENCTWLQLLKLTEEPVFLLLKEKKKEYLMPLLRLYLADRYEDNKVRKDLNYIEEKPVLRMRKLKKNMLSFLHYWSNSKYKKPQIQLKIFSI